MFIFFTLFLSKKKLRATVCGITVRRNKERDVVVLSQLGLEFNLNFRIKILVGGHVEFL